MKRIDNRSVIHVALKCSVGFSAFLVASAMPAYAQSTEETETGTDEIIVTGTLVRGIAPPGTNVIGVTSEAVTETGAASATQLLQTIPQLGSFNSLQSPAGGFNTVTTNRPNLRNLPGDRTSGSSPTLVLLDGHRVVGAGISVTSPDPDIVPPALIERVEIVPDGGSAIYGSDAVAGVINFITKKKFDGIDVGARYGFADNYKTFDANATAGRSWDTGSIYASYNYQQNDAIFGRDRDWSFSPLSNVDGIPVTSLRCGAGNVTIGNIFTGAAPRSFALPFVPGTSVPGQVTQLHRHAAVRAALTGHGPIALRLMVAHVIGGSHLFRVTPEPQTTRNDAVRESVETCKGEALFDERRRAVLAVLGFDPEAPTVIGGNGDDHGVVGLFLRLLNLPDPAVMDIVAAVMGEALAAGSAAVEAVGPHLGIDMADWWQADDAFFEFIRDRDVLGRIVAEVAGETVASANAGEKAKTLKTIIRDHLDGTDGRIKVERWVPHWMAFPPSAYTARGGIGTVAAHARVEAARNRDAVPEPPARPCADVPEGEGRLAA